MYSLNFALCTRKPTVIICCMHAVPCDFLFISADKQSPAAERLRATPHLLEDQVGSVIFPKVRRWHFRPCCPCKFLNQLDHVSNQPNCVVAASWIMITTTATLSYYLDTPECINAITLFNLSNLYRVVEPNTTVTVHHNVTCIQVCAKGLSLAHGDI